MQVLVQKLTEARHSYRLQLPTQDLNQNITLEQHVAETIHVKKNLEIYRNGILSQFPTNSAKFASKLHQNGQYQFDLTLHGFFRSTGPIYET